jgi:hypothetical protein
MSDSIDNTPQAALFAALAKAQGAFQPIEKNRSVEIAMKTGGKYRFRYADLEEIMAKTRPALSANGLALVQCVEQTQTGPLLTCRLLHANGGSLLSEVQLPAARDLGDPKAFGAAITYHRRYLVTAMLGVAADDDLDEDGQEMQPQQRQQSAGQKPAVATPQRRAPEQAPAAPSASNGEPATQGEVAYITKKLSAAGWTIAQAREQLGMGAGDTLDGLTKDGFAALKEALA